MQHHVEQNEQAEAGREVEAERRPVVVAELPDFPTVGLRRRWEDEPQHHGDGRDRGEDEQQASID
jgi:hypothetical protein